MRFPSDRARRVWSVVVAAFLFLRRSLTLSLRLVKYTTLIILGIGATILVVGNTAFRGDRDIAYRFSAPNAPACAGPDGQEPKAISLADDDPTSDNDELAAIERRPEIAHALTCMIQLHQIGPLNEKPETGALSYYLGFLEFAENGTPADVDADDRVLEQRQLDVLVAHLRKQRRLGNHSYVIAFVHGWRHNAGIGDGDVAKLRLMAAYTASFLRQRCLTEDRNCKSVVTAVYIGWRGARIDERYASRTLGPKVGRYLDAIFGTPPALLTLFDRKPVSERIGPAALTALRRIDAIALDRSPQGWKRDTESRMITFGHSLGGNMLATSLRETMLDRIARHVPGTAMTAPFGDLIVLLNPASEAANWTVLQRAMRERVRFLYPMRQAEIPQEIERDTKDINDGHKFYREDQPPIYMTLGSANTWPAGGIRRADINYLNELVFNKNRIGPRDGAASDTIARNNARGACEEMLRRQQILNRPHYDWATHDLFPAFRFDFRAAADTLEEIAKGDVTEDICRLKDPTSREETEQPSGSLTIAASFLRNFPFMNTDIEQTRTIGNLIPMRSPIGSLGQGGILPSTVYGTTHELMFNLGKVDQDFMLPSYRRASDLAYTECAVVNHWLWRARKRFHNGMNWDSGYTPEGFVRDERDPENLTPLRKPAKMEEGRLESRFRHGLAHSGMAPIVRANDPFWNVRVFETGMRDHDGYTSYPLMCAIHQLVMDRIADPVAPAPAALPSEPPALPGSLPAPEAASLAPAVEGAPKAP
jgi:hypothetical protein